MNLKDSARLSAIEDRLAIQDLIARYGPAVDSIDGEAVATLWSEDGSYQFGDVVLAGGDIGGLVDLESHRDYVSQGCAHILSSPTIEISGDEALAVNYSCVLIHADGGWRAERVSANRWQFERGAQGWRVKSRVNALLDGQSSARDLLQFPVKR